MQTIVLSLIPSGLYKSSFGALFDFAPFPLTFPYSVLRNSQGSLRRRFGRTLVAAAQEKWPNVVERRR